MISVQSGDLDCGLGWGILGETDTKALVLWEKSDWGTTATQTYIDDIFRLPSGHFCSGRVVTVVLVCMGDRLIWVMERYQYR